MGRPMRGSRLVSFYVPYADIDTTPHPALYNFDSAFQLQEYISALVHLNPHDVETIVKMPSHIGGGDGNGNGDDKEKEGEGEDERGSVDEACWIYEQLRRLAQDLTHPLITTLQQECTRQTCPEMKAGEWLYLCVAHGNSGAMEHCCAIDYIVHTLDSATALLNSPRAFPSRISIPPTSHRHFPSLARRLGRIFAHAYHHHRLAFESAEAESSLYARFLALSRRFDLVPAEFLVIPAERGAEGEQDVGREDGDVGRKNVTLLTRDRQENASAAPPPATSPSPRIGGRARTDTMYLSGGYVSPGDVGSPGHSPSPSPRRVPSPLAGTLAGEMNRENEAFASQEKEGSGVMLHVVKEVAEEPVVPDVETDGGKGPVAEHVPAQVFARDFALEVLVPLTVIEPAGDDAEAEAPPDENETGVAKTADPEQDDLATAPSSDPPAEVLHAEQSEPAEPLSTSSADSTLAPPYSELPTEPSIPDAEPPATDVEAQPILTQEILEDVELEPQSQPASESASEPASEPASEESNGAGVSGEVRTETETEEQTKGDAELPEVVETGAVGTIEPDVEPSSGVTQEAAETKGMDDSEEVAAPGSASEDV